MTVGEIVKVLARETIFNVRKSYGGTAIFCSEDWNDTARYKSEPWDSVKDKIVTQISAINSDEINIFVVN